MSDALQALAYQGELEEQEYEETILLEKDYKFYLQERRYEPVTSS